MSAGWCQLAAVNGSAHEVSGRELTLSPTSPGGRPFSTGGLVVHSVSWRRRLPDAGSGGERPAHLVERASVRVPHLAALSARPHLHRGAGLVARLNQPTMRWAPLAGVLVGSGHSKRSLSRFQHQSQQPAGDSSRPPQVAAPLESQAPPFDSGRAEPYPRATMRPSIQPMDFAKVLHPSFVKSAADRGRTIS